MAARLSSLLAAALLVFAACGGGNETRADPVQLQLTFDGDTCTFVGPTEVTPGPVELRFDNESDVPAAVNFLELLEGNTIEDMITYIGREPAARIAPSWTRELGTWARTPPGDGRTWEGNLETADYVLVCARTDPTILVWLGTGLTVDG